MAYDSENDDLGIVDKHSYDDIVPYIEDGDYGNHLSARGVSPKEAFILKEAPTFAVDRDNYTVCVRYEFGVREPKAVLEKLQSMGLIRYGTKFECLGNATVPMLKKIAKKYGLKVSGKKSDLLERITNAVTEEKLETENIPVYWKYTQDGEDELREHRYLDYFLNSHCISELMEIGINVNVLNEAQYNNSDVDFDQLKMSRIADKKAEKEEIIKFIKPETLFDPESYSTLLDYSKILRIESKQYYAMEKNKDALNSFFKSFFIFYNTINAPNYEHYGKLWAKNRDWYRISEWAIKEIKEKIDECELTFEEANSFALESFKDAEKLIRGKLSSDKFWNLIKLEMNGEEEQIIKLLQNRELC